MCVRHTTRELAVYEVSAAVLMNPHGYTCDGPFVPLAVIVRTFHESVVHMAFAENGCIHLHVLQ